MQHSRSRKKDIGRICSHQRFVKGLHFLKLEHIVAIGKLFFYLLVLPVHKESVEVICFIYETR